MRVVKIRDTIKGKEKKRGKARSDALCIRYSLIKSSCAPSS
jgi:hypothetical protein